MANNTHRTQHKPQKETIRGRELAEAKRIINQLSRKVARLQRELDKYGYVEPDDDEDIITLGDSESNTANDTHNVCTCGCNNWSTFDSPTGRIIHICKVCKARRVESTIGANNG